MTRTLLNAGIKNMADLGIEVGQFLRNNGEYKGIDETFIAHLGLGFGDSKLVGDNLCNASELYSELCREFNVTGWSRDTSSKELGNEWQASLSEAMKNLKFLNKTTHELFNKSLLV